MFVRSKAKLVNLDDDVTLQGRWQRILLVLDLGEFEFDQLKICSTQNPLINISHLLTLETLGKIAPAFCVCNMEKSVMNIERSSQSRDCSLKPRHC